MRQQHYVLVTVQSVLLVSAPNACDVLWQSVAVHRSSVFPSRDPLPSVKLVRLPQPADDAAIVHPRGEAADQRQIFNLRGSGESGEQ